MDRAYQIPDRVHRTRQMALLLSEQDRATLLAYAAELEGQTTARQAERQPAQR